MIGIGAGLIVMFGLLAGKRLDRRNTLFLVTTVATSVTGFAFRSITCCPHTRSASFPW